MASVSKQKGGTVYYAHFRLPNGQRAMRSTKTEDVDEALKIAEIMEKTAEEVKASPITSDRARQIVEAAVSDIAGQSVHTPTVREWLGQWYGSKSPSLSRSSRLVYTDAMKRFQRFMNGRTDQPVTSVTPEDATTFRDSIQGAPRTANLAVTVIKGAFSAALKAGIIRFNPFALVAPVRIEPGTGRLPFLQSELRQLLASVNGSIWEAIIYLAIYSGMRLSDLINLQERDVNWETMTVSYRTKKTGKLIEIPLSNSVAARVKLLQTNTPEAYLFMRHHIRGVAWCSGEFSRILKRAGLKKPGLSFHSLRHTCVTWLKAAGASAAMAQAWVGHGSEQVSAIYTHLSVDDLRPLISSLPVLDHPSGPFPVNPVELGTQGPCLVAPVGLSVGSGSNGEHSSTLRNEP